jgi:hypothetical protein
MTERELVARSKKLYEMILGTTFGPDEMLAFGRAVFTKTPWGALSAPGKIAMFRLTAALAVADAHEAAPPAEAPLPDGEIAHGVAAPPPEEGTEGAAARTAASESVDTDAPEGCSAENGSETGNGG